MLINHRIHNFIFICSAFILVSCTEKVEKPEVTAVKFLEAIYIHRDTHEAITFTENPLKRELERNIAIQAAQYNVLHLSMDKVKKIRVVNIDLDFFRNDKKDVQATYMIQGIYNNRNFADVIKLEMEMIEDQWKIIDIIPDKWMING